ncbi:B12-binding domain-containing radical SAM protein [candidate division KSB1 bacterium]|nr:B12-binding domain-containing radical SAM protein [candidate division KSB1 bacterium]
MAKLVLVNVWSEGIGNNKPPLGLGYLAAYLKTYLDFHDIAVVNTGDRILEKISAEKPSLVGFTAYTAGYYDAAALMKSIKTALNLSILIGGPHITCLPQELSDYADIGVIGEGEQTLLELMRVFLDKGRFEPGQLDAIPGIVYRKNGQLIQTGPRAPIVPLDKIPMPDRDLLHIEDFLKPSQILMTNEYLRGATMLSSRGCPFNCIYCHVQSKWGKPRYHSSERVVEEIDLLVKKYRVEGIYIEDDLFVSSLKRIREITAGLKMRGIHGNARFFVDLRANLVTEKLALALKEMGVVKVAMGLESGSEKILHYLKGGDVTVEQNRRAVRILNSAGIGCHCCFMIGAPNETKADIGQTQNLIREILDLSLRNYCQVTVTTPLPGTELWRYASEKGLIPEKVDWRQFSLSPEVTHQRDFYIDECIEFDEFLKLVEQTTAIANSRRLKSILSRFSLRYVKRFFEDPGLALRIVRDYVRHQ